MRQLDEREGMLGIAESEVAERFEIGELLTEVRNPNP